MDVVNKALYALGALIRNNDVGQEQFYAANGSNILTEILIEHDSASVIRKALNLMHDLADIDSAHQVNAFP